MVVLSKAEGSRLWEAGETSVDAAILTFTVGDDPILDRELLPYDCLGSAAHVEMLATIGVLSREEREKLTAALRVIYQQARAGEVVIEPEQEDGHTALEQLLVSAAGEAGEKVHTGRSRNDQVIMALRLLVRERLLELIDLVSELTVRLIERGSEHHRTMMPGYTHTRQAMPSTVGQLFFSAAEGLVGDLRSFAVPLGIANRSALGSASGYGVPLPLDRRMVADLLGLDGPDINTLHVQNTRGRLESAALFALHQMSVTSSRLAADLCWMSSEAFGFFVLPPEICTGSSIMPQKQNPDVLELVRAAPAVMLGRYAEVTGLLHGLPAGYHRDLQRTKAPLLEGLREAHSLAVVMRHAIDALEVDVERCRGALTNGIFATDEAYEAVRRGVPFRQAYRASKDGGVGIDPEAALAARQHLGAPGTDQRDELDAMLTEAIDALACFSDGAGRARQLLQ